MTFVILAFAVLGAGATVLQYFTSGSKGGWIFLLVFGIVLLIAASGLGYAQKLNLTARLSQLSLVIGTAVLVVGFLGSNDRIHGPVTQTSTAHGASQFNSTPTVSASPQSDPSSTPETPSSTSDGLPVTLTLNDDGPVSLPISITAAVNKTAPSGHVYWILLAVAYSGIDVQFYGQQQLTAGPGEAQRVTMQIPPDASLRTPRKAVVWTVTLDVAKQLQVQQSEELKKRDFLTAASCPDCEAAAPLIITPRN